MRTALAVRCACSVALLATGCGRIQFALLEADARPDAMAASDAGMRDAARDARPDALDDPDPPDAAPDRDAPDAMPMVDAMPDADPVDADADPADADPMDADADPPDADADPPDAAPPPDLGPTGTVVVARGRSGTGGSANAYAYEVDSAPGGGVIATGQFTQNLDLGEGSLTSAGSQDGYIAAYDDAGMPLWTRRYGGTGDDLLSSSAFDAAGNVWASGYFSDSVSFGGAMLTSAGYIDAVVASYDAAGNHRFSVRFGGPGYDQIAALIPTPTGEMWAAGSFERTVDFGCGAHTASGYGASGFLVLLSATGTCVRSVALGPNSRVRAATEGLGGSVWLAGDFSGVSNLGGGSVTAYGDVDAYVAHYSAAGVHLFSQQYGGNERDIYQGIAADGAGGVYTTGLFYGASATFGGATMATAGTQFDIVVARYDASGAHVFSRQIAGPGYDMANGLDVDATGRAWVGGYFDGTINAGGADLVSAGDSDGFVAVYEPDGTHVFSQRYGGVGGEEIQSLSLDDAGGVWIGGTQTGTSTFGTDTITSGGYLGAFTVRLAQ